ncbi:adenine phosphoribosyltransferase [Scaptodrosophila lebanonensis]|uniref:Adenine phosphoribosyltransferase n=1 Tax=Drosophila lebanonensis TaxID=7225 RepID=A0A6J2UBL1_DROLE|nr:adenine phosphoribosyltransferase [Scaptodrosophila lebanonensis]
MSSAEEQLEYVKSHISTYPDFPKKGIIFRDIFGALTDGKACRYLRDLLVQHIRSQHPDVELIVGLDSRGFLLNLLLATELGIGCAPIRKKGKLAGELVGVEYKLEYGSDIFEMQRSAIKPGQKVIIVDDLLATGGSLAAATQLVRKLGGVILESVVVIELQELQGRQKLDCNVHSLIQY